MFRPSDERSLGGLRASLDFTHKKCMLPSSGEVLLVQHRLPTQTAAESGLYF